MFIYNNQIDAFIQDIIKEYSAPSPSEVVEQTNSKIDGKSNIAFDDILNVASLEKTSKLSIDNSTIDIHSSSVIEKSNTMKEENNDDIVRINDIPLTDEDKEYIKNNTTADISKRFKICNQTAATARYKICKYGFERIKRRTLTEEDKEFLFKASKNDIIKRFNLCNSAYEYWKIFIKNEKEKLLAKDSSNL